jgi:hypothetical protein
MAKEFPGQCQQAGMRHGAHCRIASMNRFVLMTALCASSGLAQTPVSEADTKPLPPIRELVLQVENNEKIAAAKARDYTYHVHLEQTELDSKGDVKKNIIIDSESLTIDGVRVNRVVARNGKPLTEEEQNKESARIDKEVAKAKERREKREAKGEDTNSRGDAIVTAERILELGTFSNPRRVELNGRPTIVADYAGDPNAKTHNPAESAIRDLVGTAWFDEQDHVLVQGEGHFLKDFKIGGGLVLNIHKGFSFEFHTAKINDEAWLPVSIHAEGSARILLFDGVNGRANVVTSDYHKFRTSSVISATGAEVAPDSGPAATEPSAPTQPGTPEGPKP